MSIKTTELESDLEQLSTALAARRQIDPALKQRIRQRSEALRDERFRNRGFLNVAAELVREIRAE